MASPPTISSMFPPPDKRIVVTGTNAYPGTIAFTKNIDLTEQGVIKLSPPLCRVYSSEDIADFNLPYDIFTRTEGTYKILTPGSDAYELNLATLGIVVDGSYASGSNGIRVFPWVSNSWFMNNSSAVYEYDGSSASATYTSRISNNLDFIALFVSRNTLVGRDADNVNILKQYTAAYASSTDLTLPENFAITGAAFSNETMGVATKQRKNQGNAIFATWDGADTSANRMFEVNDPYILDVAAYKSSWVLFTSRGQLLFFNGGGFDELGRLPSYDLQQRVIDFTPTTNPVFGKLIHVDGDRVYVNCFSLPESAQSMEPYYPFYSGGAWCFDPKTGFYHTAAPSYAEYHTESVTFSSSIATTSSAHYLETGDEVFSTAASNELADSTTYYAIKLTSTTFKLATSYANAVASTAMTVTNGSYSLNYVKRYDYGIEAVKLQDCGLVRNEKDYSGYTDSGAFPFFLGAKVHPNNLSSTRVNVIDMAVPVMHNRGYFVLGKYESKSLEDMWHGVAVKYSKLKAQDKIVVKAKIKDVKPIIVGDATLFATAAYTGESVTWDGSAQVFNTTADLSGAQEGDEVHIFVGPGAGQSAHIQTITAVSGGYEIALDEALRGITGGAKSCVSIDRYKKLGTITSDDTDGIKTLSLPQKGPSMQIKVELRGIDTTVTGLYPLNTEHKLAV